MGSKDQVISELRQLNAELSAQVHRLTARIAELELSLAKAKKDSSTSSQPPSSDIVKPPVKKVPGRRKKRKQGGQPGHDRKLREPLPPERVNQAFEYEIHQQEVKDRQLTATDQFEVIQHIELLESPIEVIEHRLRIYRTADGQQITPDVPELKRPIFGPRMLAMIGWLKSRAVLEKLVGEEFQGFLNFDYFSANCSFAWPIAALLAISRPSTAGLT